jgi:hypothetical protein
MTDYKQMLERIEGKAMAAERRLGTQPAARLAFLKSLTTDERADVVGEALGEMEALELALLVDRMLDGDCEGMGVLIDEAIEARAAEMLRDAARHNREGGPDEERLADDRSRAADINASRVEYR